MLVGDIENKSDWGCSFVWYWGEKEKARCTYDWYGLPDKAKAPFDACIFAAAACRPQPDHVLCAKEEHQHNLLQITIQTQSRGYSYSVQKQMVYKQRMQLQIRAKFLKAWLVLNVAQSVQIVRINRIDSVIWKGNDRRDSEEVLE